MISKDQFNSMLEYFGSKVDKEMGVLTFTLLKKEIEELADFVGLTTPIESNVSGKVCYTSNLRFLIKNLPLNFIKFCNKRNIRLHMNVIKTSYVIPFVASDNFNIGLNATLNMFNFKHLKKSEIYTQILTDLEKPMFFNIKNIVMNDDEFKKLILLQDESDKNES